MEAKYSSETLVLTRPTWRHIPEVDILYSRRENLNSYTVSTPYTRALMNQESAHEVVGRCNEQRFYSVFCVTSEYVKSITVN
jgi:hypothetical protein